MIIEKQLFESEHIRLGEIDYEKDPKIEARWTENPAYWQVKDYQAPRPLSPERLKKQYEAIEKSAEERKNNFYFTIRLKEDDHLLGFVRLNRIEWNNGFCSIAILIGDKADRNRGYGSEALALALHFAFAELNLHRLNAWVGEDNSEAVRFLKKAGFVEEVRQRQAIHLEAKTWDSVELGLLRDEWLASSLSGRAAS